MKVTIELERDFHPNNGARPTPEALINDIMGKVQPLTEDIKSRLFEFEITAIKVIK